MRRFLLLLTLLCGTAAVSAWAADNGMLYAIDNANNSLYAIDPNTYTATFIGSTGVGGGFGDLTYDPKTKTAYWVPGRGNNNLYTVNLQTGAATLVGAHNINDLFALAFDTSTNTLYGDSGASDFYSLSTTNGAATFIGHNGVYPGGMVYRSETDQLILLAAGEPVTFNSVDRSNGNASFLGLANGFVNDNGITWDPAQGKFFVDDWSGNLYIGDPNTWQLTNVGINYPYNFDGIIYVGEVPEPGTMLLLGSGIVGLATRLRRKLLARAFRENIALLGEMP